MDSFSREDVPNVLVIGRDLAMLDALVDFFPEQMKVRAMSYNDFEPVAEDLVQTNGIHMLYVFVCADLPVIANNFLALNRPHLRIGQVAVLVDDDLMEIWDSVNFFGISNLVRQADIREGGKKTFLHQLENWLKCFS